MLLLNNAEVEQVLPMDLTMRVIEEGYRQFFRGEAVCRPRVNVQMPTNDPKRHYNWSTTEGGSTVTGYFATRLMSEVSYLSDHGGARTREKFCVQPGLFCGLVLLMDIHTGEPLAMMNDGFLQHARQGADAGIGATYLAREDSATIGMLGSGGMARSHAAAFCVARPISRMKVFSPTQEHRETFAREMAAHLNIDVIPCDNPREVYRGADILSVCTDSIEPVIVRDWLEPGMHIVDVKGLHGDAKERIDVAMRLGLSSAPVGYPDVVPVGDSIDWAVPSMRSMSISGVEGQPIAAAVTDMPQERMIYFQDLLEGRATGRTSPEQITYSERGGMRGVEFCAVAGAIYERAQAAGLGRDLPTEWFLQDIRN